MGPGRGRWPRGVQSQGSVGILGPILWWVVAGFVLTMVAVPTLLGWQNIVRNPVALVPPS